MSSSLPQSLSQLYATMPPLGTSWFDQSRMNGTSSQTIRICKITSNEQDSEHPPVVSRSLVVNEDLSWRVFVHDHLIGRENKQLSAIPMHLNSASFKSLIKIVECAKICPGHPNTNYIEMARKHKDGVFLSQNGDAKAKLEVTEDASGDTYSTTIRTSQCELLISCEGVSRCDACKTYSKTLRALYSRFSNNERIMTPSKFTNNRYLSSPHKERKLKHLQKRALMAEKEVERLKEVIRSSTEERGISVDPSLHEDLQAIMRSHNQDVQQRFPQGTFQRLFWDEQLKCAKKGAKQMRWHPTMIRYV